MYVYASARLDAIREKLVAVLRLRLKPDSHRARLRGSTYAAARSIDVKNDFYYVFYFFIKSEFF